MVVSGRLVVALGVVVVGTGVVVPVWVVFQSLVIITGDRVELICGSTLIAVSSITGLGSITTSADCSRSKISFSVTLN